MSWHRVQHPPKIVCLPFILMITSWPLNIASASGVPPYTIDPHLPTLYESWKVKSHSHGCELTNWWIESQHQARRPSIASKYSSNLTRSRPPSASPNSLDHRLQVYLQTPSITASKCISKLAQSQPPSVSPNSVDYGLQVRTITASKCIPEFTRSWPPSASLSSLDLGLQVHLQTHSVTASKYISKLAQLWPPSASLNSLDHGLQVHRSRATAGVRRYRGNGGGRSFDRHLQAHLELLTITACCQSRYTMCR